MATADEYAAWIVKNSDKKGTPEFDIVAKAYQDRRTNAPSAPTSVKQQSKPFGEQLNDEIANVPRQIGLTARHGIEGVGEAVDFLATPFRAAVNAVLPDKYAAKPGIGKAVADKLGLPTPQDATERIVGDASRMVAGAAVPLAGASKLAGMSTGLTQGTAKLMAANPLQQLASAGSAGMAGGYARETGGGEGAQLLASLAAGVATPIVINKAQHGVAAAKSLAQRVVNPTVQPPINAQVDLQINGALKDSGMTLADLPANVQAGIRDDVQKAIKSGGVLSPDAVKRLADYRLTGTTPTAATVTLDPAMVSQQKNLAKLGINSKDPAAQTLGRIENANNNQLITGLNDVGANTADDAITGSGKVIGALSGRNSRAQALIDAEYAKARATNGRSAALDPSHFTQTANNLLDDALLGGKLPADVRNLLNKAATGDMPLTVDVAEQFKTRIGDLQRATIDKAEKKALGLVRQALDDTPLQAGQDIGQESIDAFNKARRLNRSWMKIVENTPALEAVRDGIEPDKFVQQFIIGSGGKANVSDLAALRRSIKSSPDAMQAVRGQIAAHLKSSALNGAADEVGNFSQSGYNKALRSIGDRKLEMFFAPEEVAQMKAIGRVASYEQFQPRGGAVNNSNTAGAGLSAILDRIGNSPLLNKIPFGRVLADPINNISVGIQSKQALNVPNALAQNRLMTLSQPQGLLLSPAAFMSRKDDEQNSLLPGR